MRHSNQNETLALRNFSCALNWKARADSDQARWLETWARLGPNIKTTEVSSTTFGDSVHVRFCFSPQFLLPLDFFTKSQYSFPDSWLSFVFSLETWWEATGTSGICCASQEKRALIKSGFLKSLYLRCVPVGCGEATRGGWCVVPDSNEYWSSCWCCRVSANPGSATASPPSQQWPTFHTDELVTHFYHFSHRWTWPNLKGHKLEENQK